MTSILSAFYDELGSSQTGKLNILIWFVFLLILSNKFRLYPVSTTIFSIIIFSTAFTFFELRQKGFGISLESGTKWHGSK